VQGSTHLQIVPRSRGFRDIRLASRNRDRAEQVALEAGVTCVDSIADAVRGADVVCLCTDSPEPVIDARWIARGTHINSVGSSQHSDERTLLAARVVVESRVAFEPPPAGAFELQGRDPGEALELGEILSGRRRGRSAPDQITLNKSMGHAAEDAAAAGLVLERAIQTGTGTSVEI
jgi:ornithine cyclodeaminase/alanine dehydrogenase-like protein (mu-crystallin family)